jgi:hypothetical protein
MPARLMLEQRTTVRHPSGSVGLSEASAGSLSVPTRGRRCGEPSASRADPGRETPPASSPTGGPRGTAWRSTKPRYEPESSRGAAHRGIHRHGNRQPILIVQEAAAMHPVGSAGRLLRSREPDNPPPRRRCDPLGWPRTQGGDERGAPSQADRFVAISPFACAASTRPARRL